MRPPDKLRVGDEITESWIDQVVDSIRWLYNQRYTPRPRRTPTTTTDAPVVALAPFQIYQHAAATPNATSDWRTVRVHHGTIYGYLPDNDDNEFGGVIVEDIVVPANATGYKIYVQLQPLDFDEATMRLTCKIKHEQGVTKFCPYKNSNVIRFLLGTVTTGPDWDGTGTAPANANTMTITQIVTDNITDASGLYGQFPSYPNQLITWFDSADANTFSLRIKNPKVNSTESAYSSNISVSGNGVAWLDVTFSSSGGIASVAADAGAALPSQPTPPTDGSISTSAYHVPVGTYTVAGDGISATSSLNAAIQALPVVSSYTLSPGAVTFNADIIFGRGAL
jgi:hypothetical protein